MVAPEKKSIVYLFPYPMGFWDLERYGVNRLRELGFNVVVYDLSPLINPTGKSSEEPMVRAEYIQPFDSWQALAERIKTAAANSIFIDYLVGLAGISLRTERIFRMIKRFGARYIVVSAAALPPVRPVEKIDRLTLFWWKFRNALNFQRLLKWLSKKVIIFLTKKMRIYPLPHRIFGCRTDMVQEFMKLYNLDAQNFIPVHSLDYDQYLHFRKEAGAPLPENAEKYCVFLDGGETVHPDFAFLGIHALNSGQYFAEMNALFDTIEQRTGLKVVIAAHPRAIYEKDDQFGGRKILRGKTLELVADSSLVVVHASTSVNFAVLFAKPVLFIKTSEMVASGYSVYIDAVAAALEQEAILPDEVGKVSFEFDHERLQKKYEEYKYKYIKSRDVEDMTVWEIVARELEKEN